MGKIIITYNKQGTTVKHIKDSTVVSERIIPIGSTNPKDILLLDAITDAQVKMIEDTIKTEEERIK